MTQVVSRFVVAGFVLALFFALLLGLSEPALAQADGCLGKREIQAMVESGEVLQVSEAQDAAGIEGKIISSSAQLCQVDGQWQWLVNVMDSYGESKPVTLPAQ